LFNWLGKKNVEVAQSQVVVVIPTIIIKKFYINKMNRSKILHLVIKINQTLLERLVDTYMSMYIMVISVVIELGIMHLVLGHETFKTTSVMVT
jgi:hypothetical protein